MANNEYLAPAGFAGQPGANTGQQQQLWSAQQQVSPFAFAYYPGYQPGAYGYGPYFPQQGQQPQMAKQTQAPPPSQQWPVGKRKAEAVQGERPAKQGSTSRLGSEGAIHSSLSGQTGGRTSSVVEPTATKGSSWASFSRVDFGSTLDTGNHSREVGEKRDEYLMRLLRGGAVAATETLASVPAPSISGQQYGRSESDAGAGYGKRQTGNASTPAGSNTPATSSLPQPQPIRAQPRQSQPLSKQEDEGPTPDSIKAKFGDRAFYQLRSLILKHQETFMQQMWDLHRAVRLQKLLTAVCDRPDQITTELQRLEEQRKSAEAREEEARRQPPPLQSGASGFQTAVRKSEPRQGGLETVDKQNTPPPQLTATPQPMDQAPAAAFAYPQAQQGLNPQVFGYNPLTGFGPQGGIPTAGFDSMAAWYAQHYGGLATAQGAALYVAQPAGRVQPAPSGMNQVGQPTLPGGVVGPLGSQGVGAQGMQGSFMPPQPAAGGAGGLGEGALRWWQDPKAVFGAPVMPEVIASASQQRTGAEASGGGAARVGDDIVSKPSCEPSRSTRSKSCAPTTTKPTKAVAKSKLSGLGRQQLEEATGQTSGPDVRSHAAANDASGSGGGDREGGAAATHGGGSGGGSNHGRAQTAPGSNSPMGGSGSRASAFKVVANSGLRRSGGSGERETAESPYSDTSNSSVDKGGKAEKAAPMKKKGEMKSAAGILLSFSTGGGSK